ncbi:hypothetical protein LOZ53_001078 [Ophidiomyces ophidiicola]|nr:hypothetical protein LOZ61_002815 [Ophidiomyces ophidiicola]KAI1931006.1 hypothetical protein LOZ60_000440 [Ophidiomyces ophidiicola]KAI1979261.1 hypothetical protein LOZ55_002085 [Ophidiomyces ophidiicola]KAI1985285.1 hypothetical protein LOZ54_004267 [Ophidiomyces ophidiicola]KAI1991078.1 hypothetical protein LOZ51_004608 [Ophidiomyces ophidiicola]
METQFSKRRCYYIDGRRYCTSVWEDWARWVFLAIIIAGGFLIFFLFACVSARRRRNRGMQPFMGTGWAANLGKPGQQAPPPPQYQYQYPPPPQYTPAGEAGGYYGYNNNNMNGPPPAGATSNQQTGIELQQPPNAYRGETVYGPPAGPPPPKTS